MLHSIPPRTPKATIALPKPRMKKYATYEPDKQLAINTQLLQLEIVPGAAHLFEEPGTLEQVSVPDSQWVKRHLVSLNQELKHYIGE